MGLSVEERTRIINDLVTNNEMWKDDEGRKTLSSYSDEKLAGLKVICDRTNKAIAVANMAVNGFTAGEDAYRIHPETGQWEHAKTVENADDPKKGKKSAGKKGKKPAFMMDPAEEEEEEEEEETPPVKNRREPRQPATMDELIRSAPPALREQVESTFRVAQQVEQREKDKLIGQIIGNIAEPDRRAATAEWLQSKPVDELANMLSLIPKMPSKEDQQRINNAAADKSNRSSLSFTPLGEDPEMLGIPTMNWNKLDGQEDDGKGKSNGGVSLEQLSDDEWLRNAPAHIRQSVQNAVVLESRERATLIDQLVANVIDEDKERILRKRFSNKPLDELRDMLVLSPQKTATTRPSYFGQSTPAPQQQIVGNDANDILPIASIDWAAEAKKTRAAN